MKRTENPCRGDGIEPAIESLSIAHQFTAAYITRRNPDTLRNPATHGMLFTSFKGRAESLIRRSSQKISLALWLSLLGPLCREGGLQIQQTYEEGFSLCGSMGIYF